VPELDQDLVNLIMLGLLALIVLELLGVMGSLRRNRKAIDRAAKARERDGAWTPTPRGEESYAGRPSESRPQQVQAAPEPQHVAAQREPEPAYSSAAPQSQQHQAAPGLAAAAAQPAAVSAGRPAGGSSAPAAQEPQEQPFERDGRWWFRRGSELLVYDEATGQWLPAPASGGENSPAQPMPTTLSDVGGAGGGQPAGEQQGFWKCSSCGAVNGSTATTCRMCFAARP
jgi:Zn-finger in Ran binding protein and others